jgi:hypothetical protein
MNFLAVYHYRILNRATVKKQMDERQDEEIKERGLDVIEERNVEGNGRDKKERSAEEKQGKMETNKEERQ